MSNIIRIKRGITGGVVPTGLTFGELAVNITDKKLFVGGSTGNTIELLGGGGGATSGISSVTGDGSALFGYNNGASSIIVGARLATSGLTGVASFDSSTFDISTTGHVAVKTGIKANNIVVLGTSAVFGAGATGALPAVDGSQLVEVNAKYLDGKLRNQITDGGTF